MRKKPLLNRRKTSYSFNCSSTNPYNIASSHKFPKYAKLELSETLEKLFGKSGEYIDWSNLSKLDVKMVISSLDSKMAKRLFIRVLKESYQNKYIYKSVYDYGRALALEKNKHSGKNRNKVSEAIQHLNNTLGLDIYLQRAGVSAAKLRAMRLRDVVEHDGRMYVIDGTRAVEVPSHTRAYIDRVRKQYGEGARLFQSGGVFSLNSLSGEQQEQLFAAMEASYGN